MKIQRVFSMILCSFLLGDSCVLAADEPDTQLEIEAKSLSQDFAKTLKGELRSAIAKGGLPQGIEICHQRAGEIARELSVDGWQLGRTALNARNHANQPDTWEKQVMERFIRRHEQGENLIGMRETLIDGGYFRYVQAIPTKGMCLSCHGETLSPEVRKTIQGLYPNDQATGFKLGELRGAFTLTKSLNTVKSD